MLNKIMDIIEIYVTAALFALICIIVGIQIVLRTTGLPLAWTEETARYLFIWIIYLASSKAVKDRKHLSVEIIPILLKEKGKLIINILSNILCAFFFLVTLYFGFIVLQKFQARPQLSPAMGINMIIPYAAPAIGSLMMLIRTIQNIITDVKQFGAFSSRKEVL